MTLHTSLNRRPRSTQGCRADNDDDDDDDDTSVTLLERRDFSGRAKKIYETCKRLIAICTQHCAKPNQLKFVSLYDMLQRHGRTGDIHCPVFQKIEHSVGGGAGGSRDVLA